eukprot:TRINITY_DN31440_c0_g1_i1.p1 TRINITY_DN31440_c0_g1~~TRINITY_DN31440_c0_g1_i1.p1  ORF type:complete len:736 (+),score=145.29 TRINITY_DN31440_c0_g1_i1:161-2368(+)
MAEARVDTLTSEGSAAKSDKSKSDNDNMIGEDFFDGWGEEGDEVEWYIEEGEEEEDEHADDPEIDEEAVAEAGLSAKHKQMLFVEPDDDCSSVSNEVSEDSDVDHPDIERSTAQVYPDRHWYKVLRNFQKMVMSCMLPILLLLLFAYAILKSVKVLLQFLMDVWVIIRYLILLVIRILLFPFYITWKLFIPRFIQNYVWERYDKGPGKKIRLCLKRKKEAEDLIADSPNVLLACFWASYYTCIKPTAHLCKQCMWHVCGKRFLYGVIEPSYDTTVNQVTLARKKFSVIHEGEEERSARSLANMLDARLKKAKLRARRAKAREIKKKRQQSLLELKLHLPAHELDRIKTKKLMLEDKQRIELLTRTMVVERRYAVAVGFWWSVMGLTGMVVLIDGSKDDTCHICEEHPEIGMRMCRHGAGQDCAFYNHSGEVVMAIIVIGIGIVLLVYSLFVYRPHSLGEQALKDEIRQRIQDEMKDLAAMNKWEDDNMQALELVEGQLAKPTFGRKAAHLYHESVFGHIVELISEHVAHSCLMRLLDFEERHNLAKRSIKIQHILYFFVMGWLKWIMRQIFRCIRYLKPKRKYDADGQPRKGCLGRCIDGNPRCRRCVDCFLRTPLGGCISWVASSFMSFGGEVTESQMQDAMEAGFKLVDAGARSSAIGVETVEETVARFGLDKVKEAGKSGKERLFDMMAKMQAAGFEEIPREAGTDVLYEDVTLDEPTVSAEDTTFARQFES